MAHYSYSQLPTYADDIKTPLLADSGPPLNEEGQSLALGTGGQECATKRSCFFGRLRARCAARCAAKYGPPCDNERCIQQARKRRTFRLVIFSLLGLFFIVHLFKGASVLFTLPKRINCEEITSAESSFELPLTRKLFVDYSLTNTTTSIVRSADAPKGVVTFHVSFDQFNVAEEEDKMLFCSGQLSHRLAVGILPKHKHGQSPPLKKTTIVLPTAGDEGDEEGTMIKFGGKKMEECMQKMVRRLLKWKKKHGQDD